jgi:hypothetical protein
MKGFIAKAIASGLLLSLASPTVFADSRTYKVPNQSGIVWVVLEPVLKSSFDTNIFQAPFCVTWGSYNKCFSASTMSKSSGNYFAVAFSHFDNQSLNMNVTTSVVNSRYGAARIIDVYQGSQPSYSGQTILTCGRTITC